MTTVGELRVGIPGGKEMAEKTTDTKSKWQVISIQTDTSHTRGEQEDGM